MAEVANDNWRRAKKKRRRKPTSEAELLEAAEFHIRRMGWNVVPLKPLAERP